MCKFLTYERKPRLGEQGFVLVSKDYDLGLVEFLEQSIEVDSSGDKVSTIPESSILAVLKPTTPTIVIKTVFIEQLPTRGHLTLVGQRIDSSVTIPFTDLPSLQYNSEGYGLRYGRIIIRCLAEGALTEILGDPLRIYFNMYSN